MRFMMLMIPKGYENAAPDTMPDAKAIAVMSKYNNELQAAGALISLDGLHPLSMGARVVFSKCRPTIINGSSVHAQGILGGYWIIQAKSMEEAIVWASRCPASDGDIVEVRQVQEFSEFPDDVKKAASGFTTLQAKSESHVKK